MLPIITLKITSSESEISAAQSLIAELQSRIAAEQTRIAQLTEDNAVADGLLQAAQAAKGRISDQEVLADIQAELMKLFGGDSPDSPNDGGNLPVPPAPQPNDDGGSEVATKDEPTAPEPHDDGSFDGIEEDFADMPRLQDDAAITPQPEVIEQAVQNSTPADDQLAADFQSELKAREQKLIENAPMKVQYINLDDPTWTERKQSKPAETQAVPQEAPKEPGLFDLVPVSDNVAYFRNNKTGVIGTVYAGFNSKSKAEKWGKFLTVDYNIAIGFQSRESKRLTAFKYELKLWGLSLSQIQKLAASDLQQNPHNAYGKTSKKKSESVAAASTNLEIADVQAGDTVRSVTVKNWLYTVKEVLADGFLDCERIGSEIKIRGALHPASVELVSKASKGEPTEQPQPVNVDINDVPVGIRLEQTDDALLTEYRVWAWCVARVFGKPELQEKSIGTLVESAQGINAHRPFGMSTTQPFTRTLDAVKHLVKASGYELSGIEAAFNQRQQEIAIASSAISPEQAKSELFGGGYDPAPQDPIANAFGNFGF